MPSRFRLCHVVVRGNMTPQGLPIQFVCGVGPRTLVCQPTGLEPPIHARLAHLEPPSRLRLAPTTPDKIHHPLAQIY
ncbi:MAG: hypothetical protein JSS39_16720 [Nitrospira sp.]|nr:hypothetical protein [Nitrospira sp.]